MLVQAASFMRRDTRRKEEQKNTQEQVSHTNILYMSLKHSTNNSGKNIFDDMFTFARLTSALVCMDSLSSFLHFSLQEVEIRQYYSILFTQLHLHDDLHMSRGQRGT